MHCRRGEAVSHHQSSVSAEAANDISGELRHLLRRMTSVRRAKEMVSNDFSHRQEATALFIAARQDYSTSMRRM